MTNTPEIPDFGAQFTAEAIDKARFAALLISPEQRGELIFQVIRKIRDEVLNGALVGEYITDEQRVWEGEQLGALADLVNAHIAAVRQRK
ncbi:hypothetical protein [Agreia sp. COWG]|uniref:hypothetical protein n=1 Tax=Agreia sp. COWG TaxID=2773266 RepID=UPI0019259A71|nr:hypothetical protein [Agreia sp. COWG]CAD5994405.1 protein of unknown function [Agreia sp. COWG]